MKYQKTNLAILTLLLLIASVPLVSGCKTKADMRREQEVEQMKADLNQVRGTRADLENSSEELKAEIARLNNLIEERAVQNKQQLDEIHKEVSDLTARISTIETRATVEQDTEKQKVVERPKATFEIGKKFYDDGNYDEAVEAFKTVSHNKDKSEDAKKALYWLAESYYSSKEYASAAIEFAEFKKEYAKDALVPQATYRQANAFRSLNKVKEAKLFYQELLEKFPKHPLAKKAKVEMRKLKG
jgi:TolA-binding protein